MSSLRRSRGEPATDWDVLDLGAGDSTALLRLWKAASER